MCGNGGRSRDRQREGGIEKRARERESYTGSMSSAEPDARLDLTTVSEIMTCPNQELDTYPTKSPRCSQISIFLMGALSVEANQFKTRVNFCAIMCQNISTADP